MRPIFWEFQEPDMFSEQGQWLLGDSIMAVSMAKPGMKTVNVRIPRNSNWYRFPLEICNFEDLSGFSVFEAGSSMKEYSDVKSELDEGIPMLLRGGKIIATKERPRRNSVLMQSDPFTVFIALDKEGKAEGRVYEDDGRTYGKYGTNTILSYKNNELSAVADNDKYGSVIERIILLQPNGSHIILKKPKVQTGQSWSITVQ